MTRKEAKVLLPIIKAYVEGKTIECRTRVWELNKGWKYSTTWKETKELKFQDTYEYRIKPEPKYRPFKNAEECWNEMQKHEYFGWIKAKDASIPSRFMTINSIRNEEVSITSGIDFTYNELVEHYTFIDRTPFGIKEEE